MGLMDIFSDLAKKAQQKLQQAPGSSKNDRKQEEVRP